MATFVIALLPLLGMAALAVDIGMIYVAQNQLRRATDMGTLAGVKKYGMDIGSADIAEIQQAVAMTVERNNLFNDAQFTMNAANVALGTYDTDTEVFTVRNLPDPNINAMEFQIDQPSNTLPYTLLFLNLISPQTFTLQQRSMAMFGERLVNLVYDNSVSMQFGTYIAVLNDCSTRADNLPYPYDTTYRRLFKYLPDSAYDSDTCLGGLPEPATTLLTTTRDVLLQNDMFNGFYRLGLILYGTTATNHITLENRNNVDEVETLIDDVLSEWANWANQPYTDWRDIPTQNVYNMEFFPGGFDPTGEDGSNNNGQGQGNSRPTGGTNIIAGLAESEAEMSSFNLPHSVRISILLSDGLPTCTQPDGSDCVARNHPTAFGDTIDFADNQLGNDHMVHTIYLGRDAPQLIIPEGSSLAESLQRLLRFVQNWNDWYNETTAGIALMQNVASVTNGQFFYANNPSALEEIFRDLENQPAFVLV